MSSWFNGTSTVGRRTPPSRSHSHSHSNPSSHPHTRPHARAPETKNYFVRPARGSSPTGSSTSRGFFSWVRPAHRSAASYYKRAPRQGFVLRLVATLRRLVRGLLDYARRNPVKLVVLVVMPLLTGGALQNILRHFGVRLPAGLGALAGGSGGAGAGGAVSGLMGGGGLENVLSIAKMFI